MDPVRILIATTDSTICGTERMVLSLLRHLPRRRYLPMLVALKGPGDLIHAANRLGVDAQLLRFEQNLLRGVSQWWKIIREFQPAVIHSFLFHTNLLARLTKIARRDLSVISGLRTVYTVQDYGRSYGVLERLTHPLDTFYVANSQPGMQSVIHTMRLPERKIVVIPNGLEQFDYPIDRDSERNVIRSEFGFTNDHGIVGIVAQLRPPKRHDLLIQSIAKLNQRFPSVRLLIIGQGDIEPSLRELSSQLGVAGKVVFAGYRSDARRILLALDVFALPSVVEGQPVSILEAMDASLPVVATRVGGIPDIVVEGETGFLVEPGNLESFTASLERLLSSPELRLKMGQSGKQRVQKYFSAEAMAEQFQRLYEKCLM